MFSYTLLQFVPDRSQKEELYREAVSNDGNALRHVPRELITEELCRLAVNQNINALSGYIPEQSRTIGLYVFALKKDAKALRYVPRDMRWDVLESVSKSDNVPLMIELIKDMKFRGHHIAPEWFKNGNTLGNGSVEDQDAEVDELLMIDMEFTDYYVASSCFRNGNISGNGSAEDQDAVSINDMRCYYEELSRILSVNGNNTLFTSPVSQILGSESGPAYPSARQERQEREETLHAEGSSGIADCIRSFLF